MAVDDVGEECDEGLAGVARHGLAEHLARLRVERGKQRERPVAAILEAMSLGAPGGQGQDRIQAIEGLNRRFLVDGKYGSCGALRYRPMISAAFRSKSGSSDNMYRSNRCGFRRARCHALWT
jgi:hypothetical protein